jgi:hypothetical protein
MNKNETYVVQTHKNISKMLLSSNIMGKAYVIPIHILGVLVDITANGVAS